jgi:D-alanine-D-alanine ligase
VSLEDLRARVSARRPELAARRVVVLAGGGSAEREVSLRSGEAVVASLQMAGYQAQLAIAPASPPYLQLASRSGPKELGADAMTVDEPDDLLTELTPTGRPSQPPIVISTMHGGVGLLELVGVPYASPGVKGSAVAMDKALTKRIAQQLGMPTPQWWVMRRGEEVPYLPQQVRELVAKPACEGSSVGVTMLDNDANVEQRLYMLSAQFDPLLIEERISGRELTLGMIGPTNVPCPLPVIEIVPKQGFYDFDNKYTAGATEYLCPADVDDAVVARMAEQCTLLYRELDLGPMARFDFILDEAEVAWFLEVNTLPGFTSTSLLPKAAAAASIGYTELLEILLLCALERWEQKHGDHA